MIAKYITRKQALEAEALLAAYKEQQKEKAALKKLAVSRAKAEVMERQNAAFEQRRKQIWEMRQTGATYAEIGELFGISKERVRSIVIKQDLALKRANTPPPRPGSLMTLFVR